MVSHPVLREWLEQSPWDRATHQGTLSHISAEVVLRGVAEVKQGHVLALGRQIDAGDPSHRAELQILPLPHGVEGSEDWFGVACHGFNVTHLDAVGHSALDGVGFRGVPAASALSAVGLLENSIEDVACGIVTRGVLLDVAASAGVPYLEVGQRVSANDLDRAEAWGGVPVLAGDAIFVRTGFHAAGRPPRSRSASTPREGLDLEAVTWVRDHAVSVYSGDCVERIPSEIEGLPMPLHQLGHVGIGLAILDNPDVEELRDACVAHQRNSFMLAASPLRIRGGTGSPVNPIAVF